MKSMLCILRYLKLLIIVIFASLISFAFFYLLIGVLRNVTVSFLLDAQSIYRINPGCQLRAIMCLPITLVTTLYISRPYIILYLKLKNSNVENSMKRKMEWNDWLSLTASFVLYTSLTFFGVVYLMVSFVEIHDDRICYHTPYVYEFLKVDEHSYEDVTLLLMVKEGMRSKQEDVTGPHYCVHFNQGRKVHFNLDSEGMTQKQLEEIVVFLAKKTSLQWREAQDSIPVK